MAKKRKTSGILFSALLFAILSYVGSSSRVPPAQAPHRVWTVQPLGLQDAPRDPREPSKTFHRVTRVIDGDTLELEGGARIRLIGIDTPESSPNRKLARDAARSKKPAQQILVLGRRASEFTRELLRESRVRLEYDAQPKDRYGRWLAYVFLEDGRFVNAEIMRAGYATAMTVPPNVKYQEYLGALQKGARSAGRGLWS